MTIAIAIRTRSAAVFAADSKVTTRGFVGFEKNGQPRWMDQTYDNAVKVVRDRDRTLMAMVAGSASIGDIPAADFLSQFHLGFHADRGQQDNAVLNLVNQMVARKQAFWATTSIAPDQWPGPTILLGAPGFDQLNPRVWLIELAGATSKHSEILTSPGVYFEGSFLDAYTLLYGFHPEVLRGIGK